MRTFLEFLRCLDIAERFFKQVLINSIGENENLAFFTFAGNRVCSW